MKRKSILKLDFYYKPRQETQPMLGLEWYDGGYSSNELMASSDFVFAKFVFENKKLPNQLKKLLYGFCVAYIKFYDHKEEL